MNSDAARNEARKLEDAIASEGRMIGILAAIGSVAAMAILLDGEASPAMAAGLGMMIAGNFGFAVAWPYVHQPKQAPLAAVDSLRLPSVLARELRRQADLALVDVGLSAPSVAGLVVFLAGASRSLGVPLPTPIVIMGVLVAAGALAAAFARFRALRRVAVQLELGIGSSRLDSRA